MSTIERMYRLWAGPGDGNPGPEGPEGEHVGEDDEMASQRTNKDERPVGPGAPMVPDHQNIDSNPIDPRVF